MPAIGILAIQKKSFYHVYDTAVSIAALSNQARFKFNFHRLTIKMTVCSLLMVRSPRRPRRMIYIFYSIPNNVYRLFLTAVCRQ